jgi:hypothetical protein
MLHVKHLDFFNDFFVKFFNRFHDSKYMICIPLKMLVEVQRGGAR